MPEAVSFINHGGQNSVMTGLVNGVPQIIMQIVQEFETNPMYRNNAKEAGEKLLSLGGVSKVIDILEDNFG